jgi:hypothetical protein
MHTTLKYISSKPMGYRLSKFWILWQKANLVPWVLLQTAGEARFRALREIKVIKAIAIAWSLAMYQAVSHRPLNADARVSMWDLLWTKQYCERFAADFFGFLPPILLHRSSAYSYITWGMNNRPGGGCSSETSSHDIDMNNNKPKRKSKFVTIDRLYPQYLLPDIFETRGRKIFFWIWNMQRDGRTDTITPFRFHFRHSEQ